MFKNILTYLPLVGLVNEYDFIRQKVENNKVNTKNLKWLNGKFYDFLYFNGNDSYLKIIPKEDLEGHNTMTFMLWVNDEDNLNTSSLLLKGDYTNSLRQFGIYINSLSNYNGNVHFGFNEQQSYYANKSLIKNNKWNHILIVYNGLTIKMYLNGKLYHYESFSNSFSLTETEGLVIGYEPTRGYPFLGMMLHVFLSYDLLTEDEIKEFYEITKDNPYEFRRKDGFVFTGDLKQVFKEDYNDKPLQLKNSVVIDEETDNLILFKGNKFDISPYNQNSYYFNNDEWVFKYSQAGGVYTTLQGNMDNPTVYIGQKYSYSMDILGNNKLQLYVHWRPWISEGYNALKSYKNYKFKFQLQEAGDRLGDGPVRLDIDTLLDNTYEQEIRIKNPMFKEGEKTSYIKDFHPSYKIERLNDYYSQFTASGYFKTYDFINNRKQTIFCINDLPEHLYQLVNEIPFDLYSEKILPWEHQSGSNEIRPIRDLFGTFENPVFRQTGKIRMGRTDGTDVGTLYYGNSYIFSVYLRNSTETAMEFDITDRADLFNYTGLLADNVTDEWKRFLVWLNLDNNSNYSFIDLGNYQSTETFEWCCPMIQKADSIDELEEFTRDFLYKKGIQFYIENQLLYFSLGTKKQKICNVFWKPEEWNYFSVSWDHKNLIVIINGTFYKYKFLSSITGNKVYIGNNGLYNVIDQYNLNILNGKILLFKIDLILRDDNEMVRIYRKYKNMKRSDIK